MAAHSTCSQLKRPSAPLNQQQRLALDNMDAEAHSLFALCVSCMLDLAACMFDYAASLASILALLKHSPVVFSVSRTVHTYAMVSGTCIQKYACQQSSAVLMAAMWHTIIVSLLTHLLEIFAKLMKHCGTCMPARSNMQSLHCKPRLQTPQARPRFVCHAATSDCFTHCFSDARRSGASNCRRILCKLS